MPYFRISQKFLKIQNLKNKELKTTDKMTDTKPNTKMGESFESIETPTVQWITDHHSVISKPFNMALMRIR